MKGQSLYIDCTYGVSGDMLCRGLTSLCGDSDYVKEQQASMFLRGDRPDHGHHHRSFREIEVLIGESQLEDQAKAIVLNIYTALAKAEAEVHKETLDTVHFHEVGRNQAIENMVGIAAAIHKLAPEHIFCSTIHDGVGTVMCSHGEISVPVPAVKAMMKQCQLQFVCDDVKMERVTPTGLAALIGLGAEFMDEVTDEWIVLDTVMAVGTRTLEQESSRKRFCEGMKLCRIQSQK